MLAFHSSIWERYTIRTHVGFTKTLVYLLVVDVGLYVVESCAIRFFLRLRKLATTFDSQAALMETVEMVSDHHVDCW